MSWVTCNRAKNDTLNNLKAKVVANFKDHFSEHAAIYRSARPHYPNALFEWLAGRAREKKLAWDCGCGNGQASVALAAYFRQVVATDPSAAQIANAEPCENVEYRVEPGERTTLADNSVDLVTVAQALHWFDLNQFYSEVKRVLKPHGLIAVWTYADCSISPQIDRVKDHLYVDVLGNYWPPERRLVESGYVTLPFPFMELSNLPKFSMIVHWNAEEFLNYLRSWSATQRYLKTHHSDPVEMIRSDLLAAWENPQEQREVSWGLSLRVVSQC